ncbi:MAG TPA: hypothetical protein VHM88_23950 [Candidatus Acidoferrales bacterium]|jgi:hypothetical protein|nr:hypothetical protein [Candidatus Acidoferrales bacterium]
MSRGFDGFEIDDFRDSDFGWGRDRDRDRSSDWNNRLALHNIHREEDRADKLDRESRERSDRQRPPLPREERVEALLAERSRTKYADRNKQYSLRDSEIHTLGEVGKFRVVAVNDLAEFAYNGDRSRARNDIENLASQGLLTQTTIADLEHNATPVLTLTKEGHKLLSRGKVVPSNQATYHGLKKPKEAFHDADLYRLYHKVSDEIESRGGKVLRVQLDYELKQELYSRLARLSAGKRADADAIRKEVAGHFHLKVVSGRIPIPDLRIEYVNENDNEIQRRDLELATEHYRPRGLSEKARAGFEVYARPSETDRLRRIRDERELSAAIFSL